MNVLRKNVGPYVAACSLPLLVLSVLSRGNFWRLTTFVRGELREQAVAPGEGMEGVFYQGEGKD